MTVPIDAGAALIVLLSCAVGYAVYRHTRNVCTTVPKSGDVGVAFSAGAATLLALAFLFGLPSDRGSADRVPPDVPSQTTSAGPFPESGASGTPQPGGDSHVP